MRSLIKIPVFLAVLFCLQVFSGSTDAQEVRKAIRDYKTDRVFQYQPSDPWYRGKVFNTHTGHYGKFYNCDNEECKRNSPYICWKAHHEHDFPNHMGFWGRLKYDLSEVRQRLYDGAGACAPGCTCNQCSSQPAAPQSCGCAECQSANAGVEYLSESEVQPTQTQPSMIRFAQDQTTRGNQRNLANPTIRLAAESERATVTTRTRPEAKFGLVSGRISEIETRSGDQPTPTRVAEVPAKPQPSQGNTTTGRPTLGDYFRRR